MENSVDTEQVGKHPLMDKGFLNHLVKKLPPQHLVFLIMILFFTFVLLVIFVIDMDPFYKFILIFGMFVLIAFFFTKDNKKQEDSFIQKR